MVERSPREDLVENIITIVSHFTGTLYLLLQTLKQPNKSRCIREQGWDA